MKKLNRLLFRIIMAIRPLVGPAQCRYTVTCTKYAKIQLEEKKLLPALWAITKRVLSCNPIF